MLKIGQIQEVEITGYSSEGEGVCRVEGCAVFVPNAIRGERCTVKITHVSRNSAHGKIEQILTRSPRRIPRACPEAKLCGGCQLHHMDYAEELYFKAQKVTDALRRLGGIKSLPPEGKPSAPEVLTDDAAVDQQIVPITGADGVRMQNARCEMQNEDGKRRDGTLPSAAPARQHPVGAVISRPREEIGNGETDCHDQSADWSRNDNSVGAVIGRPPEATGSPVCRDKHCLSAAADTSVQSSEFRVQSSEKAFPLGGHNSPGDCCEFNRQCDSSADATGNLKRWWHPASPASRMTDEGSPDDSGLCRDGVPAIPVPPAARGYRNKAQYPISMKNGKPVAGFYKNRTHEVIPVQRCAILPEVFDRVRDLVIRWAQEDRVSVYDEHTGKGLLRHIYVRRGAVSGQVMVCLVVNGRSLPRENRLVHTLQREIPGLASVQISVNTKNTNVVLGDEFRTLWGKDYIEDTLCGFSFRLSPRSFYQVNHDQAQRLYEKALEFAQLHGTETVLDLYCGTGTITLALSRQAGRVVGVELVPQAIEDAKQNARRNGVENVEFFCADAKIAAERICAEGANPHVIVVDPPRKGLAPEVIDAMVTMAPERIVYVSCDPATLARDVKLLTEKGYALTRAEAFDLFPRTFHVETVVQLSKGNISTQNVRVEFSLEDMDMSRFQQGATYEQIQEWVQEKYGFHVTHLNIAQVKRKHGIIERENYNKAKSSDSRQPGCPEEKVKAIEEALKYFQMI